LGLGLLALAGRQLPWLDALSVCPRQWSRCSSRSRSDECLIGPPRPATRGGPAVPATLSLVSATFAPRTPERRVTGCWRGAADHVQARTEALPTSRRLNRD